MNRFSCPKCKTMLQASPEQAGKTIACPKCKTPMRVPSSPITQESPSEETVPPPSPAQAAPPPLPAPAQDIWFYALNGQQTGPVPVRELKELIRSGKIGPQDLVWKAGTAGWEPAGQVQGLFERSTTTATPPPLPPPGSAARSPSEEVLETQGGAQTGPSETGTHWGQRFSSFLQKTVRPAWVQREQRKQLLHGSPSRLFGAGNKKWEPVGHDGPALLFFADGGFMRSDGFGAKFGFDPATDIITLTVPGFDTAIPIKVLSVTKEELVLAAEGRALHYQQGHSISPYFSP
jgi:hypothetical protein